VPDAFIQRFLDDPRSREALSWFRSAEPDTRTLGELPTTAASIALVEGAYAAGVAKVIAVEIEDYPENTGKLVLEMPDKERARARASAWAARIAEGQGFDAEVDTGQSHIFVMLD
jgi:hypothetical protein